MASISKEKAGELRGQIEAIATSSGLKQLRFRRRSAPAITSEHGGSVDILSADNNAGAAGSYDLAICDELGLLSERNRPLVNSMRSSVSAKGGKFLSLSVAGDGPFIPEILERKGAAGLALHHYHAPEGCELADEAAWDAANPGLACGIKSRDYMRSEAARVAVTRSDEASFRSLDLNQPGNPGSEMILSLAEWQACVVAEEAHAASYRRVLRRLRPGRQFEHDGAGGCVAEWSRGSVGRFPPALRHAQRAGAG